MSSEWNALTVGDLVRQGEASVQTGPFGSQLHSHDYVAAGTPVIPTEAIGRGRIVDIEVPMVDSIKAAELSRHRLRIGDILFARRGAQATGLAAIVDQRYEGALCGTGALLLRTHSARVDPLFLAMFLSGDTSYRWLRTHAVGAVMPNLNTDIIKALPLLLPSIEEQRELAGFVSALDNRIALLRETNATLEAIAQALFKSWFVDFDPIVRKLEKPNPIGCAWDRGVSSAVAEDLIAAGTLLIGDGYRAKNNELGIPGLPFVRGGDLVQGQITPTKDFLSSAAANGAHSKMAKHGDTAFTSKGTIGRFAYVDQSAGDAAYSPQVCFWRSLNQDFLEPTFLHYWMKSEAFAVQVKAVSGPAAIMEYVSLSDQRKMKIDLPSIELQRYFAEVASPILDKIACNRTAASHLSDLRDTLLPRLISGQLRLPEARAELEEAT